MEIEIKILKKYLQLQSDRDLEKLYWAESGKTNRWEGLPKDVFQWISEDEKRGEWAILNEIARRWVNS